VGDRFELSIGPKDSPGLKRTLSFEPGKGQATPGLWVRFAEGSKIVAQGKNTWSVDDRYQVTISESIAANAKLRDSGGKQELVVPVALQDAVGQTELEYYVRW
jgi:hypothetical protein